MDILITFTLTLVMFAGVALIFRKPMLWYLKIEEHLANQKEIIRLLSENKQKHQKSYDDSEKHRKKHHHQPNTNKETK